MIYDKGLDVNRRFTQNMKIYTKKIANKNDREVMIVSVAILEDTLDKLLKVKLAQVSAKAELPQMSYSSKVDLCYKMELIKSALRRTLQIFGNLVENFTKEEENNAYGNLEVQTNILELCKINDNDIFNLILKLINSDPSVEEKYEKVDDLVEYIGWSGTVKFICSIINASLIEALIELE
ncbi:hypothetical protein [Arcobacter sp. F2176]|uniref:hypothetical protein n=1 Tax=Arcobacter sp. F2176 TaxID=2044511 RepID=UPI00100A3C81|nr:hypothetical protein [Arcobacter sp. F2176]RXJ82757.1 hypothetical protein CRU95_01450 [Arcobacter sp. F2176]